MTVPATLPGLARRINEEHAACMAAAQDAVARAVEIGRLLTEAKDQLAHGQWGGWVAENCDFGIREAQRYMQTYEGRDRLADQRRHSVSHLTSLRGAVASLAAPAPARGDHTAGEKCKYRECVDWIRKHGNRSLSEIMHRGGFSAGTVAKAREYMGLTAPRVGGGGGKDKAAARSRSTTEPGPIEFDHESAWERVERFMMSEFESWPDDYKSIFKDNLDSLGYRLSCLIPGWSPPVTVEIPFIGEMHWQPVAKWLDDAMRAWPRHEWGKFTILCREWADDTDRAIGIKKIPSEGPR